MSNQRRLYLKRISSHKTEGTFGVLLNDEKIPFAVTLELPDKDNAQNISCIPAGIYFCYLDANTGKGKTFRIQNVPGRVGCLFHKGNILINTLGCILVGESFDPVLGSKNGITHSKDGFEQFIENYEKDENFMLHVEDCF